MSVIHNWHNVRHSAVVIDTETTGFEDDDEIVEISIIDAKGAILLDTLVKPIVKDIPAEATAIHGITNDDVENAPHWDEIYTQVRTLLHQRKAIFYSKSFDVRLINQTCRRYGLRGTSYWPTQFMCALESYADYRKIRDTKRGGYKWHKLSDAARHEGIELPSDLHRSLADAQLTLALIQHTHATLQSQGATA